MDVGLSDARDIHLDSYLRVFALVFLYYDHLITIDREIKFVWTQPKKPSTYWFLANRYFFFSVNIVVTLFEFMPSKSPKRFGVILSDELISQMVPLTVWALFAGQNTSTSQQMFGCHTGISYDTSKRLATAWEASFAYDSIIFTLTLMKRWRAGQNIDVHVQQLPIFTLLLRDGAIYFAVMALANLANILTFYFCGPFLRGGLSGVSTRFVLDIQAIYMNTKLSGGNF
ncbi:hypothetical protein BD779DRAFT_1677997 [Infundibulicybe gibba]|nr:hypothetical protein BD779DRAFT_1677997 [Infundibulicybe gibba]